MKPTNLQVNLPGLGRVLVAATVAAVVVSCGSGGSPTAGIDRGGIRVASVGPVTGFSSVLVNGERYDIAGATIEVNGLVTTEADLAVGQVVVVDAALSADGSELLADSVSYESNLQGPVETIDIATNTLVALGQQIAVDAGTSFDSGISPASLAGLMSGDIVEVSGLVDTQGRITATRLELEDNPDYELQLSGVVADLVANQSFRVGDQAIDFSEVATLEGFPSGAVSEGDRIRVLGDAFGSSGELLASSVSYRGRVAETDAGDEGEIEGLVTAFVDQFSFQLNGFAVLTNGQTEYSGGTAADLGNNIRIEAEGTFDAAGTLRADSIEFREEGDARIEAAVDAAGVSEFLDDSGVTQYSIPVFGVTVVTTSLTAVEDKRDEIKSFNAGDISPGDYLKVEGTWDGAQLVAVRLERIEAEDKFKLRGPAESANSPEFVLLGLSVLTEAGTTDFEVDDAGAGASGFFNSLQACIDSFDGCEVEAEWETGSLAVAKQVSLEL
jgi:hypothetical protein